VKVRLLELLPDAQVFLDVDFLGGAMPESHIDVSSVALCFCTRRWFTSMPCVREAVRAVLRKVPLIALLDADTSDVQGGHGEAECRSILASREYGARLLSLQEQVATWAMEWGVHLDLPSADEITTELFNMPAIVWYRLSDLQDVSMRMIAERMMPDLPQLPSPRVVGLEDRRIYHQVAYVQEELAHRMRNQQIPLTPLSMGCNFHIYCSAHNHGAIGVMKELVSWCPALKYTTRIDQIRECEHIVVLLTGKTWMPGEASENFAHDVWEAMRTGVHRFLIHEVPGARQFDNDARHARPFEYFFEATPEELITAGLYNEIAMNLAGDEWRAPGLIKTVQMLAKGGIKCDPVQVEMSFTAGAGSQTDTEVAVKLPPSIGHGLGEDRHRDSSQSMRELGEQHPLPSTANTSDEEHSLSLRVQRVFSLLQGDILTSLRSTQGDILTALQSAPQPLDGGHHKDVAGPSELDDDGVSLREDSEAGAVVEVTKQIENVSLARVASFDTHRARTKASNNALTRAKQANSSKRPQGKSDLDEQTTASSSTKANDCTLSSAAFESASGAVEEALMHSPRDRRESITEGASRRMSERL